MLKEADAINSKDKLKTKKKKSAGTVAYYVNDKVVG